MRYAIACVLSLLVMGITADAAMTDAQVKQAIIQQSLASYPGNCPCPYSTMRNGRSCGKRSAYSRPGGYAPICYEMDVTPAMVREYRQTHGH
jgi:hypothetical protein